MDQASLQLRAFSWERLAFCLPVVVMGLVYAFYTHHAWEDFLITFRHSRNLAEGNGLVFQPGEYIHGFTSPINVLLPAWFYWAIGVDSYQPALWLYRIVSLLCLAGGLWILHPALKARKLPTAGILIAGLMMGFEGKTIVYAINGQEAGFLVGFLLMGLTALLMGMSRYWLLAGIAWGGLMWSRPDGCVHVAALGLTALVFADKGQRKHILMACLKAAAVCTVIYLPWFTWAWWYYGTPVPHTILAKSHYQQLPPINDVFRYLIGSGLSAASLSYEPINVQMGGWPIWLLMPAPAVGLFVVIFWAWRRGNGAVRLLSFYCFLVCLYLGVLILKSGLFTWYMPPLAFVGTLVLGAGPLASFAQHRRVAATASLAVLAFMALLFCAQTHQLRHQQAIIETGHRKVIGQFLADNVRDGERVMLECLGYIGYYSNAKMLDYPGLASPEVVAALDEMGGGGLPELIVHMKPEWLVLRPVELRKTQMLTELSRDYTLVQHFNVADKVEASPIWGKNYLLYDSEFYVLRRRDIRPPELVAPAPSAATSPSPNP